MVLRPNPRDLVSPDFRRIVESVAARWPEASVDDSEVG
jgi:hypothetical protein